MYASKAWAVAAALILSISITCDAAQYTYWVDKSCSGRPDWDKWIAETFSMARRASERLADEKGTDFANVFNRIYSTPKDSQTLYDRTSDYKKDRKKDNGFKDKDTAYNIVHSTMASIGNDWRLVTSDSDRLASDVRIYCDNGAHFNKKSKHRPGYMNDMANMLRTDESCGSKVHAVTNSKMMSIGAKGPRQNSQRCSITICDRQFKAMKQAGHTYLGGVKMSLDLTKLEDGIMTFQYLMSRTLLHEFTHTFPYLTEDVPKDKSYGWDNITKASTEDSVKNADNLAYLGLWAQLADRTPGGRGKGKGGYSLARPWEDITSDGGAAADKSARDGHIDSIKDITGAVAPTTRRFMRAFRASTRS